LRAALHEEPAASLSGLERALAWSFRDRELLARALTHSSHSHESDPAARTHKDNEQLEFLGDAVLGLLVSELLVARFPQYSEGRLSKLKAHLVSAAHLYEVAQALELGKYLRLGRGEELSGGRAKRTLLVDGLEALIAALYLDGGIDEARRFVSGRVMGEEPGALLDLDDRLDAAALDFKSALQELAQDRQLPQPRYFVVAEKGPEHSKLFTIEVRLGKEVSCQAEGASKKLAAQRAARDLYEKLRNDKQSGPGFTEE
jgi:ribonuclease III